LEDVNRWVLALCLLARAAHADSARLGALRAKLPASKCELGAAYAQAKDLPRAALFLDGCNSDDEHRVNARLDASELSKLTITSDPPGLAITTDALPGETITTPAIVWAKAGTYTITGAGRITMVQVAAHTSRPIVLENRTPRSPAPHPQQMDFADEPTDSPNVTQPPDQQHPSMLPCKYTGCDTHDGGHIDDPLATRAARVPIEPPNLSLGLRAGASAAFHAGGSRIAPSLAIDGRMRAGRFPGLGPAAIDLRLDWAMRGGDNASFDAFGASAQYGAVVFAPSAAWLSVLVGLRGELRTATMLPIDRVGIGYTGALELALRSLPITVGLRYDEDLTELAPGIRERAVIVELGGELRAGLRY
jgi:hypothetical protein